MSDPATPQPDPPEDADDVDELATVEPVLTGAPADADVMSQDPEVAA